MGAHDQGADATGNRWLTIPRTLCFVLNGSDVLLMRRAPHRRVFPNKYNGVGGHIERDEDPFECAIREIKEETGLDVRDVRLCSVHNIDAGETTGIILFVFTAWSDSREVTPKLEEGTLEWISRDRVLEVDLVEDLPIVLPRVLSLPDGHAPVFAHVSYDDSDTIVMRFSGDNG